MSRYIDANDFEGVMYHEAFETDTEMQRWDSGCWIRYKLFENLLEKQPTADVVEVVRCKDCIYYHPSYCKVWSIFGTVQTREHGFCYMGERREDG